MIAKVIGLDRNFVFTTVKSVNMYRSSTQRVVYYLIIASYAFIILFIISCNLEKNSNSFEFKDTIRFCVPTPDTADVF